MNRHADGAAAMPLFYRRPQPLSTQAHARWRLRTGDYAFAEHVNAVPLVCGEFAAAGHDYPVIFAGTAHVPVALLGLERSNLFVEQGRWEPSSYVPAYVRRYPFVSMAVEASERFVLAIDGGCERFVEDGEEGEPLFEDGTLGQTVRTMADFCEAFRRDGERTREWAAALAAQGLLDERHADVRLPDGRALNLEGFQVVDGRKLVELDPAIVADWHRKGWLGWIHLHLASLQRFTGLLQRRRLRETAAA